MIWKLLIHMYRSSYAKDSRFWIYIAGFAIARSYVTSVYVLPHSLVTFCMSQQQHVSLSSMFSESQSDHIGVPSDDGFIKFFNRIESLVGFQVICIFLAEI